MLGPNTIQSWFETQVQGKIQVQTEGILSSWYGGIYRRFINFWQRTWLRGPDGCHNCTTSRPSDRNRRRFSSFWRCRRWSTRRFRYRHLRYGAWCRERWCGWFTMLRGIWRFWRKCKTPFLLGTAGNGLRCSECWKTRNTRVARPTDLVQRWAKCWFGNVKACTGQNLDTLALPQRLGGSDVPNRHWHYGRRRAEWGWCITDWAQGTFHWILPQLY